MARILVIDNYDSFVYNIVSYLAQIGAEVEVWRNDDPRFASPGWETPFDGVLLSPGPGTPERAGVCVDVIRELGGRWGIHHGHVRAQRPQPRIHPGVRGVCVQDIRPQFVQLFGHGTDRPRVVRRQLNELLAPRHGAHGKVVPAPRISKHNVL